MMVRSASSAQAMPRPFRPAPSRGLTPAGRFLVCGRVPARVELLVRYVDSDENGNPRLIEYIPERPRNVA